MSGRFEWYDLRTTDIPAASAFYADVLGLETRADPRGITLCASGDPVASISSLPEAARARGAPAHWLGQLGVANVAAVSASLQARGAERLGPPAQDPAAPFAILRDPFGALLGLRSPARVPARAVVRSHDHLSRDHQAAWALYAELFGWQKTELIELDLDVGPYQRFAWDAAGESAGALLSAARSSHIHTQWLYYFGVTDIERAVARVRALGGLVVSEPLELPFGARITQCDDAQGAAFGLWEG